MGIVNMGRMANEVQRINNGFGFRGVGGQSLSLQCPTMETQINATLSQLHGIHMYIHTSLSLSLSIYICIHI